ncbi:hypothetical protein DFH28DRAFT_1085615 [Melampsora americana]|nr:hypothetical protein DFH28DRAFT_1085615 [Melampsora americana]
MNPPPMRSDVRRNQVPPLGNPAHPQTSFLPGPSISYPPPHHGPTGSLDPHSLPPPLPQSKQPVLQMHNTYPHQPPGMMSTQGLPLHSSQGGGAPLPYRDGPNPYGQPMNTNLLPVDGYKMPHQNPRSGNMAPPTSSAHDHHHQPRNSRNLAPSRPPQFHQLPGPPNLALPPRPMLSYVETGANEPIPHKTSTFHNNLHQPNMPLNPLYGPPGILNGPPAPAPILTQSAIGSMNHNNREFDRAPRDTYIPGGGLDGYPNHMRNGNGPRNQNERRYHRNHHHHPHQNPHQNLNNLNGHDRWTPSNSNQPSLQRERGEYRNRGNEGRRGGGGGGGGGNRGSWSMNSSFNNGNGEYIQGGLNRSDHEWSHSLGPPPPPPSHPNPNSNSNSNLPPSSNPLPNQNGIEGSVPLIRYVGRPQDDGPHLEY